MHFHELLFRLYQKFVIYLHCQKVRTKGPKGTTAKMTLTKFMLKINIWRNRVWHGNCNIN